MATRCRRWSPDGKWIYLHPDDGLEGRHLPPPRRAGAQYTATYPTLYEITPDGSGRTKLTDGRYSSSPRHLVLLAPSTRPSRRTARPWPSSRMRPNPTPQRRRPPVLRLETEEADPSRTCRRTRPSATRMPPGDPTASVLLYVHNGRDGPRGAPQIYRYNSATKKATALTGPRLHGAVAGRPTAATSRRPRPDTLGTDVVDPRRPDRRRGPAPDQRRPLVGAGLVAARRRDRLPPHRRARSSTWTDDRLDRPGPNWTVERAARLTEYSGLDASSRAGLVHPARPAPGDAAAPAVPALARRRAAPPARPPQPS